VHCSVEHLPGLRRSVPCRWLVLGVQTARQAEGELTKRKACRTFHDKNKRNGSYYALLYSKSKRKVKHKQIKKKQRDIIGA
jgi:hypothetical protein